MKLLAIVRKILLFIAVGVLILPQYLYAVPQEYYDRLNQGVYYYDPTAKIPGGPYNDNCSAGAGTLPGTVPAPYNAIFTQAGPASNVSPALVAAIFFAGEHGHSWPDPPPPYGTGEAWARRAEPHLDSSNTWPDGFKGSKGPFQFLFQTWDAYKKDGNADGNFDVEDLTDGAYGAANYLGANGGTVGSADGTPGSQPEEGPSIRSAIWHYNHSNSYVETVFEAYQEFLSGGSAPSTEADCGGGIGVGPDGFVFPLKTTKKVIREGSSNERGTLVWCYTCQDNDHHDYNAADIHAPTGTEVLAAVSGTVIQVSEGPARLHIQGEDGHWYYYTHLLAGSILFSAGDTVTAGQVIGRIGASADAEGTAPHVHFDIATRNSFFNRPGPEADAYLVNPQPKLVEAFNNLREE